MGKNMGKALSKVTKTTLPSLRIELESTKLRRRLLPLLYSEDEVIPFADEAELIENIEYYMAMGASEKRLPETL